ncbi:hypothetical protein TCON_2701, partial [Astathelohania contejeani]
MLQIRSNKDNDNIPYVEINNEKMEIIIDFFKQVNDVCESLINIKHNPISNNNARTIVELFRKNILPLMFINTIGHDDFKNSLLYIFKKIFYKVSDFSEQFSKYDFKDFISDSDICILKNKLFSILNDPIFYNLPKIKNTVYDDDIKLVTDHIESNELYILLLTFICFNCNEYTLPPKNEFHFAENYNLSTYLFSLIILDLDDDKILFHVLMMVLSMSDFSPYSISPCPFYSHLIIPPHILQKKEKMGNQIIKWVLTNQISNDFFWIRSFIVIYNHDKTSINDEKIKMYDIIDFLQLYAKNQHLQTSISEYCCRKNNVSSFEDYIKMLWDTNNIIKDWKINELITKFMLNLHRYSKMDFDDDSDNNIIKECLDLLNNITLGAAQYLCKINNFINNENEINLKLFDSMISVFTEILEILKNIELQPGKSLVNILSSYIFTNKGIFLKKNFKDNNNIKQIVPIFNEDKRRINRRK